MLLTASETAPAPYLSFCPATDRSTDKGYVPVPIAGSMTRNGLIREAFGTLQIGAECLISQAHHPIDDLNGRVVRTCALSALRIVEGEEVLDIQVEVDVRSPLSGPLPLSY